MSTRKSWLKVNKKNKVYHFWLSVMVTFPKSFYRLYDVITPWLKSSWLATFLRRALRFRWSSTWCRCSSSSSPTPTSCSESSISPEATWVAFPTVRFDLARSGKGRVHCKCSRACFFIHKTLGVENVQLLTFFLGFIKSFVHASLAFVLVWEFSTQYLSIKSW